MHLLRYLYHFVVWGLVIGGASELTRGRPHVGGTAILVVCLVGGLVTSAYAAARRDRRQVRLRTQQLYAEELVRERARRDAAVGVPAEDRRRFTRGRP
jgi:hypothetical protein